MPVINSRGQISSLPPAMVSLTKLWGCGNERSRLKEMHDGEIENQEAVQTVGIDGTESRYRNELLPSGKQLR